MSRASRLAELRALRESGKTRLTTYKVAEEENLYEEVDEEGYKKVVRARLDQDDFVIDDNGEGYADDGREEWMGERRYDSASGSEEEVPLKGKAAKRKREEEKEKTERVNNSINKYFSNGPVAAAPKPRPIATLEDASFMADLLGEVDVNIPSRAPTRNVKTASRHKTRVLSPPVSREKKIILPKKTEADNATHLLNTPPLEPSNGDDEDFIGAMDDDVAFPPSDPIPSSPTTNAVDRKGRQPVKIEDEDEDMMEVAQAIGDHKVKAASVNMSGARPAPKIIKAPAYPSPASSSPIRPPADNVDASAWNDVTSKLNVLSSQETAATSFGKTKIEDATEDDGSLRFFWTDYTEVNGSLCLFGKVKDQNSGAYIEAAEFTPLNNASWCKFEAEVASPKAITSLAESDNLDAPPLTFMSIALRTTLNVKENKQEILIASARVYENVALTDTTRPEDMPCKTYSIMRPVDGSFPAGFDALSKKQRGTIQLAKTENMLLAMFLALLERADPDVLMGHQLQDVDYPVLLSRLREKKTPGWHRIGRLRRNDWPKNMGKGGNSFFAERQLISGRLLCDVANDMGKSLMTKCQQWSLTEMCELYLSEGDKRREIDNDAALKTWATSREGLLNYVNHCEADTYFVAAIAMRVQILPLSKVLTNLAGNSWARTLSGTRAERNEYILLHEFNKNKYICPDKIFGKGKPRVEEDNLEGEESVDVKKKDKFKGGLVFEPEKGLYDKFILVMDFNSLYPSIIQEYNICFTTVDRSEKSEDDETVPDVPVDQNQGILPKLIATLVSRRRQVKSLMKDKKATADQLATWDIKQMALKLTANSMYGCLGYTQSRFYARPLAMLTTFKGREILRSTKDLAESTQLRVIYGDTDSVMINTNADNIEEALKVGVDFKRSVNEKYKLLEIDIDNIFRRLLLHAKKKYAAINMVEVDGKYVDKLEVKGLDMKRREYCALSKDASSRLLNLILSGEEPEMVVGKVHEYLRELSERMREEKVPAQKYIIFTKLGKDPKDYPNPDSMPQVQVALRALAQGKSARVNDVISYIMTGSASAAAPHESAAKRAYAPGDVTKAGSELKPDVEWYLYKQIFPPIERLCAPMPGTDAVHLAECLGLDTKKYSIASASSSNQSQEISPLESQIPDSIRFKDCARLNLKCRFCKHPSLFEGLAASITNVTPEGVICSNTECRKLFSPLTIVAQLEHAIRLQTSRYYDGYLICDDSSCGNHTRQISVYGHRCLGPRGRAEGCLGKMRSSLARLAKMRILLRSQEILLRGLTTL
ncbi:DNA polymerase alpha subunit A, partial [Lecanoromycetidae sp. Uapishka_2]